MTETNRNVGSHCCKLTRILYPFLKSFLQSSDVQRFGGHVDQHHDLQELLLPGLAQLLNIISAWKTRNEISQSADTTDFFLSENH